MEQVQMIAEGRVQLKKTASRNLRKNGLIPAVVYHKGDESQSVQVGEKDLQTALATEAGRNVLINLKVQNESADKPRTVVIKDIQYHPVTGRTLHVDFHQISLTEKIKVKVPIVEKGEAIGVKQDGGLLELVLREIEVECLPTQIPESIEVEISELKINDSIHVRELVLPADVATTEDEDGVVVRVVPPHVEEAAPEGEGESSEPEVIGEKKDDEEASKDAAPSESKEESKE